MLCPSMPPAPRLACTRSQAISRFFRLYTLSISECTFLAPVGLIQSASLLGRWRSGLSQKELSIAIALTHLASLLSSDRLRRPPSPTHSGRRSLGHVALATLQVLLGRPTTRRAPLPFSLALMGSLPPVPPGDPASTPGVTRWSSVPCRPQTPWCGGWMRTPSPPYCGLDLAPPLADRFVLGVAPIDYGPVLLRRPFGFRLAAGPLSSEASRAAAPGPSWPCPAFACVPV